MQERWWDKQNRNLIKRYFRIFRPYQKNNRPLIYGAALGLIITSAVNLTLPWVTMRAVDHIIHTKEIATLVYLLVIWVAAVLARAGGGFLSYYHLLLFTQRMTVSGQMKLLKHIIRLPVSYFNNVNIGYAVSRVRDDVAALNPFWVGAHLTVVQSIITVLISLVLLFSINTKLTLVMLALTPLYLLSSFVLLKRIRQLSYESRELAGVMEGKLHESLSGASTIRMLSLEHHAVRTYFQRVKAAVRSRVRLELVTFTKGTLGATLQSLVPILVVCYAGFLIYHNQLSVGGFIGFFVYVSFLLDPLSGLFNTNTELQRALAPLQRVFEVLDMKKETEVMSANGQAAQRLGGDIVFERVTFSYDGSRAALDDLSVHIPARKTIGICGVSGAGKTTFVNLLIRLYEPNAGTLYFDGIDARELSLETVRRSIGIVSQDVFLFNASIHENLACGAAHLTRRDVEEAARLAEAHDFISALKDGYDTMAGVRGLKLSGGERARISITRALLRDPSILVLDEATAFMDSQTESLFREATRKLFRDKTVIIIAHRISSLQDADMILVFDEGKIVEQGTHTDLAEAEGLYGRLCREQMKMASLTPAEELLVRR